MTEAARNAPKAMIAIAMIIAVISLLLLITGDDGPVDTWLTIMSSHPHLGVLKLLAIIAGLVAAVGLWRVERWAPMAYLLWAASLVTTAVVADSLVEPVPWKLFAGAALVAVLPALGAVYIFKAYERMRTRGPAVGCSAGRAGW